jgi:signal transduction histidine kinase
VARRIPIRRKLAAALAIPIAALLVVAGLEVLQSTRDAAEVKDQTDLATASVGPSGVISSLQDERNYASLWLLNQEKVVEVPVKSFDEAKQRTDAAIDDFRSDVESKGGEVVETYGPAFEALDGLTELRQQVDTFQGERSLDNTPVSDPNFVGYTEIITGLFEANTQVALAIDDPVLRRGVELSDLASRQTDVIARTIRSLLLPGVTGNSQLDSSPEIADASGTFSQVLDYEAQVQALGAGVYEPATRRLLEENEAQGFIPLVQKTLDEAPGPVPVGDILATVDVDQDTAWYGFRHRVEDILVDRADDLNAAAERMRLWFMVLAVVAVGVAVGVTWVVSRSITRPLRSLTGQATAMADHRLPEAVLDILDTPLGEDVDVPEVDPVAVHTRDEVADVADALNTVQDSALDLAVEQAVLRRNIADSFVNLGRRNQNLLGRQLDFITELESNETNPDTLSNLFRLDHLATRMRRNAESLLVLAGVEPPRKWAAPVRLTDVIRAALGEVEDYQRVTVRGVEPATIVGAAAADLAHLLAELIENALVFSPPDQTVDIRGRARAAAGADEGSGYTLAVIDAGLGMPPADIEAANRRLAGEESFTIAPSKYLGHYVAGNLAARHGIGVRLDASPGNGITATVNIPPALLTTDSPIEDQPPVRASQSGGVLAPVPDLVGADAMAIGPGSNGVTGNGSGSHLAPFPPGDVPEPGPVPMPGPMPAPPPPPAARTASGLVKRARRGAPEPEAPGAPMPAGDLLANLSNVATNLTGRGGVAPAGPPPSGRHATPPMGPSAPPGQGPWLPPDPGAPGSLPRRRPGRPDLPGPNGPGRRGRVTPPTPPGGSRTASGLTRRVRGAQLPTGEPLSLRRTADDARTGPGPGAGHGQGPGPRRSNGESGNGHAGAGARHDDSSARDVYSFLTSFTAGVQRGLDEAKRHPENPEENE